MGGNDSDHTDVSDTPADLKKNKKGIIYLSTLPKHMNVTRLREIMENFGEVGRIYLQPQGKPDDKKPAKQFSEGWIEFEKKRVAKEVAKGLNNNKIESRKKSQLYDYIWNIRYLSKFKWVHLSERVAYERAVRKHRMRMEISQAKREATDFSVKADLSEKLKIKMEKEERKKLSSSNVPPKLPRQKKTEDQYIAEQKKKKKKRAATDPEDESAQLLKSLFS